jgi:hypothetical protein
MPEFYERRPTTVTTTTTTALSRSAMASTSAKRQLNATPTHHDDSDIFRPPDDH